MSIINSQPLIGASGNQGAAYNLTRSLRFRSSAAASLTRTPASLGSTTTWTWSAWVKRGVLSSRQGLFITTNSAGNNYVGLEFLANDKLAFVANDGAGSEVFRLETNAVFRDPSAWYHIVVFFNTTQATAANRAAIYVNNVLQSYSTSTYMSQNYNSRVNTTNQHNIGNWQPAAALDFDGYIAEVNFIDGQALTPSSFGETDTATGVWKPKKYTGTYGTNGFYLKFDNTTSTSTLGNDSSGNSNTWTVNNVSLTSGSTYDSMKDVPTLTDADTANYCVLNPLSRTAGTPSDGNLKFIGAGTSGGNRINGTVSVNSGKWYYEVTILNAPYTPRGSTTWYSAFGFGLATSFNATTSPSVTTDTLNYQDSGYVKNGSNANTDTGSAVSNGDVLAVAVDLDANTYTFYKNNTSVSSGTIGITAGTSLVPMIISYDGSYGTMAANFGQRPFAYTPPSGFKALNTFNLPTPTIGATASTQANDYFDISLWTGTGSSQSITNSGSFQPDFVWGKIRSGADYHVLTDAVRGNTKFLKSNTTDAETTETQNITSFNSNGFTLGTSTDLNRSTYTFVGWQWKANGSGSTNTAGSITSTVSANTTAGFSIVTYTGTGANATVGHGLGVAPKMVIVKCRNTAGENWQVYHSSLTSAAYRMRLNTTDGEDSQPTMWNSTAPTSTVFSVGTASGTNANTQTYVAYCFTDVAGYSAFGKYTGNGSTDGPFIYTGFRPKYILIKNTGFISGYGDWYVWDSVRNTYNIAGSTLRPNTSDQEYTNDTAYALDIVSNGFKVRNSYNDFNASSYTYIYAAFAENPFKYSLAR